MCANPFHPFFLGSKPSPPGLSLPAKDVGHPKSMLMDFGWEFELGARRKKGETHGVGDPRGTWGDEPESVCFLLHILPLLSSNNKIRQDTRHPQHSLLLHNLNAHPIVLAPATQSPPIRSRV